MAISIHKLIAAINPDLYCDSSAKSEVKNVLKTYLEQKKGYLEAAKKAKPKDSEFVDMDSLALKNPFSLPLFKNPIQKHFITYDAYGSGLESIYFWLLDKIDKEYDDVIKIHKLVDNFVSSSGSAHFSEMGMKATKMQEEGMKMLVSANQVLKSVLNLLYDLKEFKLRLDLYDKYFKSKDAKEKQAAILSLKQLWMDSVDTKRGNSAIKVMAQNFDYVTIIDAFMATNSLDDVMKSPEKGGLDLNERVRRILQQRISEFFVWVKESEVELRKRFEIEKIYLKSQVNALKLYARWAKPYLRSAQQLEQKASPTAALVTTFNTSLFELTLLIEGEYLSIEDVGKGNLPAMFKKPDARSYRSIMIVEFKFRSVPERAQQGGYGFRGKVEITFTSYALNEQELKILINEIERDDLEDTLKLIEGATTESLEKLQEEIDSFLSDAPDKNEKKSEKENNDSNPFSALFSLFKPKEKKKDKKSEDDLKPDSSIEKVIRNQALFKARKNCTAIYNLYKKSNNMPTF